MPIVLCTHCTSGSSIISGRWFQNSFAWSHRLLTFLSCLDPIELVTFSDWFLTRNLCPWLRCLRCNPIQNPLTARGRCTICETWRFSFLAWYSFRCRSVCLLYRGELALLSRWNSATQIFTRFQFFFRTVVINCSSGSLWVCSEC